MAFFSTWRTGMARRPGRRKRTDGRRLTFDILEDRTLLSVYVVDRLTDLGLTDLGQGQDQAGDLRYCLARAANGDTITFDVEGTIGLKRPLRDLTRRIDIEGPGADRLTVRRATLSATRIFTVMNTDVTISGLTVADGYSYDGGGIYVDGGSLTLADSVLLDNFGNIRGGGLYITNSTAQRTWPYPASPVLLTYGPPGTGSPLLVGREAIHDQEGSPAGAAALYPVRAPFRPSAGRR